MCSWCRRKGTLTRRLLRAEVALESTQTQRDVYERLLQEKQQHIDRVSLERDARQMENKQLEAKLEHAHQQLDELRIEKIMASERKATIPEIRTEVESSLFTPSISVLPVNMSGWSSALSGRRKLPQVPCTIVDGSESGTTWGTSRGCTTVTATSVPTGIPPVVSGIASHYNSEAGGRPLPGLVTTGGASVISSTPQHTTYVGSGLPTLLAANSNSTVNFTSTTAFHQPPGFKELRERVGKFTGNGEEDFEVWLADYSEATGDCGWTDQLRAHWFSWFLAGAAKYTWQ